MSKEQRLRHTYLIGATGTGKSTLILSQVVQDIESDLGDRIIGHIPEERYEDIVLFDPSDTECRRGINVLTANSEVEKNVLSSDLVAAFKRVSTS